MKTMLAVWCTLAVAAQAQMPLVDLKTAEFTGAERTAAGVKCALKLPAKRSNWTSAD
jgi:hypothetical protein